MHKQKRPNDAVHLYMGELTSRIVAESHRPEDRFHLGKLILQGLRDAPDFILQIDGATGESETFSSALKRSVQCAHAFRELLGLKPGDVIILMAPNHLHLTIPYYAALYLGVSIAPIDRTLGIKELQYIFSTDEPKIVFCQAERANDVREALKNSKLTSKIVTFDREKQKTNDTMLFDDLLKLGKGVNVDEFKASDFDPEETVSILLSTSGTTGLPKQAMVTHKNFVISGAYIWNAETVFPTPTRGPVLVVSPLQWITAMYHFNLCPLMRYTRVQTSKNIDLEHTYYLINTYKPTGVVVSPTLLVTLMKHSKGKCDWTCFDIIAVGGGAVSDEIMKEMKVISPNTIVLNVYGMSEIAGVGLSCETVPRSCGKPAGHLNLRLINIDTKEDVVEANVPGELWLKGPSVFKGYYKNEEATKEALTEDGWFKTGDLFYRDEYWSFYFVERIKMLLKYKNHQVSPAEIEHVIRRHPSVVDVAVCGLPDLECGDLPVACVVRRTGQTVTAKEIKDLVKENLTDTKQLRGGVIFLDAIPITPGGKADYNTLKKLVLQKDKE